jgi:hypothetical protein
MAHAEEAASQRRTFPNVLKRDFATGRRSRSYQFLSRY